MDIKEEILPSREFALILLRKEKLPGSIRRHSIRVANKALAIAKKIRKVKVDTELVVIGGILHDIGRARTHSFEHALIGGKILREKGLPEKLARICETHVLGGLDKEDAKELGLPEKDYLPHSIEEKIVCLADKMSMGTREVSIEQRFKRWFEKYGKSKILVKSEKRIKKIQKEILDLM
ncbi:MAG: HD domain-containing protein [Promethearchaeota archaeon]